MNKPKRTYKKHTHDVDPRIVAFKRYYLDSSAPTFCNIRQSALKAGYSKDYAENLSGRVRPPKWWLEFKEEGNVLRAEMLRKAEKRLDERVTKEPENDLQYKVQTDVAKFVAERVGKQHYSTRQEVTGAEGRALFANKKDKAPELEELFVGVKSEE